MKFYFYLFILLTEGIFVAKFVHGGKLTDLVGDAQLSTSETSFYWFFRKVLLDFTKNGRELLAL